MPGFSDFSDISQLIIIPLLSVPHLLSVNLVGWLESWSVVAKVDWEAGWEVASHRDPRS